MPKLSIVVPEASQTPRAVKLRATRAARATLNKCRRCGKRPPAHGTTGGCCRRCLDAIAALMRARRRGGVWQRGKRGRPPAHARRQ